MKHPRGDFLARFHLRFTCSSSSESTLACDMFLLSAFDIPSLEPRRSHLLEKTRKANNTENFSCEFLRRVFREVRQAFCIRQTSNQSQLRVFAWGNESLSGRGVMGRGPLASISPRIQFSKPITQLAMSLYERSDQIAKIKSSLSLRPKVA